uniref:Uncharacterized protein n=1 Tax=viral metagenome TaxID=1070528 RepID=A0A6C0JPC0_9ZZZZ
MNSEVEKTVKLMFPGKDVNEEFVLRLLCVIDFYENEEFTIINKTDPKDITKYEVKKDDTISLNNVISNKGYVAKYEIFVKNNLALMFRKLCEKYKYDGDELKTLKMYRNFNQSKKRKIDKTIEFM